MTSPILRVATHLLIPPLVLLGLYLLWRGHDQPGGGFIAALVFGVALALRGLTDPPEAPLRFPPASILLGSGLALAIGTAVAPLLFGSPLLTSAEVHLHPPVVGDLHLTSSLLFDSGVAFIVVGLLRGMIDALEFPDGSGAERATEERP